MQCKYLKVWAIWAIIRGKQSFFGEIKTIIVVIVNPVWVTILQIPETWIIFNGIMTFLKCFEKGILTTKTVKKIIWYGKGSCLNFVTSELSKNWFWPVLVTYKPMAKCRLFNVANNYRSFIFCIKWHCSTSLHPPRMKKIIVFSHHCDVITIPVKFPLDSVFCLNRPSFSIFPSII